MAPHCLQDRGQMLSIHPGPSVGLGPLRGTRPDGIWGEETYGGATCEREREGGKGRQADFSRDLSSETRGGRSSSRDAGWRMSPHPCWELQCRLPTIEITLWGEIGRPWHPCYHLPLARGFPGENVSLTWMVWQIPKLQAVTLSSSFSEWHLSMPVMNNSLPFLSCFQTLCSDYLSEPTQPAVHNPPNPRPNPDLCSPSSFCLVCHSSPVIPV